MKNQYIIECTCIDEGNDFEMQYGEVGYYNKNAKSFRYHTKKWSTVEWENSTYKIRKQNDGGNPYFGMDLWTYYIPVTPIIDNATFFKNLGTVRNKVKEIEAVGDFRCKILVVKTIVEAYEEK